MKRLLVSALLFTSPFACASSVDVEPDAVAEVAATAPVIELDEVLASTTIEPARAPVSEPAPVRAPVDAVADRVPAGAFADVASFCAAQEKLVAPRVAEANARWIQEGMGELNVKPECHELPEALADATTSEFLELRTVRAEIGGATEVYVLARGDAGWEAVRAPFLTAFYDDPGCGSIEREHAIKDIHEDGGRLVVTTESQRGFYRDDDDSGELTLSYARTCRAGAACSKAVVVAARAVAEHAEDAPPSTRTFTTTYAIAASGVVVPAATFDETRL